MLDLQFPIDYPLCEMFHRFITRRQEGNTQHAFLSDNEEQNGYTVTKYEHL